MPASAKAAIVPFGKVMTVVAPAAAGLLDVALVSLGGGTLMKAKDGNHQSNMWEYDAKCQKTCLKVSKPPTDNESSFPSTFRTSTVCVMRGSNSVEKNNSVSRSVKEEWPDNVVVTLSRVTVKLPASGEVFPDMRKVVPT